MLAFSAVRNNDRVGLLLFTNEVEVQVPPAKGGEHVLRVVRDVLCHEPVGRGTDLAKALGTITRSLRKRAIVFVVSDFLSPGGVADYEFALRVAARKHDVVAVAVSDPREETLPDLGLVQVEDAESGRTRLVDTSSRAWRERYRAERLSRVEERNALLRRIGVDLLDVSTVGGYDKALMAFFRARERRARLA